MCSKDSTGIAAIELDEKTHESKARAATDAKKNKATADAGLKLIRWQVSALPDGEAIRKEIAPALPALAPTAPAAGSSKGKRAV